MTLFKLGFLTVTLIDLIDIILVTWVFYKVYQYFKDTRAGQMLIGLVILLQSENSAKHFSDGPSASARYSPNIQVS